ncbi:Elongation factor P [bioreactor metagenome]|jgi:translation initiation factor 5A|uniref:Translation initiation factor 5A n=1 Tax=bioreactor metagenome TaxID=1076179 RepID=A0A645EFX9_9ZZZZ|nr:translation initiation factor IF-5A [Methanomassiliicoccales archaeon RumEn M2]MDD2532633.1 translation initiation factor IF-5A [Candidatus Methanomethylophilaceae archaeon]MDI9378138.1 translation initiation factor IF-5A [Candidatus Thermoplasmatota archaeon]MDD2778742.1 translation initiation factor IF-5A [Candidatus Methanomethylophilaceae archaeon]MDD3127682.1 translation initiation factor IF-5A [Candidatus Methanomethylophilaceae archaeon]
MGGGDWEAKEIRELKVGRYVNIDDEPCKIISISTSKPGKHGSAKANIDAVSIFSGSKKSLVGPVSTKVQVPMIDKRKAQVLAIHGDEVQIMDLETFETFSMAINADHESVLEEGGEIMYLVAMDRMKLM